MTYDLSAAAERVCWIATESESYCEFCGDTECYRACDNCGTDATGHRCSGCGSFICEVEAMEANRV